MDNKNDLILDPKFYNFISHYVNASVDYNNLQSDNDKTISSAYLYEKIRVAVEYQEEHLIFKNAIARILRRKFTLSNSHDPKRIFNDLVSELAWANYVNPELVKDDDAKKIINVIEKYTTFIKYANSGRFQKHDLQKMIVDWLACEIDQILSPDKTRDLFLDFAYSTIIQNLDTSDIRTIESETEIQLKVAIYSLVLKPDLPLIQFWLINKMFPEWSGLDLEDIKKVGRSFDPFYNRIDRAINHPLKKNYQQFTKRYIPPFILLHSILLTRKIDLDKIREKPRMLHSIIMEEYNIKVADGRNKVFRGTFRALLFILMTKISLAFILEMPFDRLISGSVDILSLTINVTLPPFLMFVSGTFVKSPPLRNHKVVSDAVFNLLTKSRIDEKTHLLVSKTNQSIAMIFNIVYAVFTISVLFFIIWLLIYLKFNIVSIGLFFFFVSVVSFFAFRIRNIALELAMKRSRDDALTTTVEFVMMPFIQIGKFFSDKFAAFNPMILALDFLIEAPLKTVIKIMNSWLKFINAKKEELEL